MSDRDEKDWKKAQDRYQKTNDLLDRKFDRFYSKESLNSGSKAWSKGYKKGMSQKDYVEDAQKPYGTVPTQKGIALSRGGGSYSTKEEQESAEAKAREEWYQEKKKEYEKEALTKKEKKAKENKESLKKAIKKRYDKDKDIEVHFIEKGELKKAKKK